VKARILSLDSAEHVAAQELLPWFVNGTLTDAQAESIAAHLAQCERCRNDVAEQAELRGVTLPERIDRDVDRHWAALRRRIEAAPRPSTPSGQGSPSRWRERWLWTTVAVQAAVLLALTLVLVAGPLRDERYHTLGAAPPAPEANAVAVFRNEATNQQMRDALHAVGARIVAGPTVTDAYLLRLNDMSPAALGRLRAQPGVVRAEPLQGEPGR
jgi:hypothetical protein